MKKVYVVQAYRWGDPDAHSYVVGVFDTKEKALQKANNEEQRRAGKYKCVVMEFEINKAIEI